jgi:hypothetical protein
VLVLGTIVHQQQQPRRAQAVDQTVEQGLGLAVDPVEVLEHHEQRLRLALAQQQTLDGLERAPTALGWIEGLPAPVLDRHVEEREERGQQRLQRPVEAQHPPQHLGVHVAVIVAVTDLEIAFEQVDCRQVTGGLAVRHRRCLQDEAVLHAM